MDDKEEIKELPYEQAELLIYLCDCRDRSSHVDVSWHTPSCQYRITYTQILKRINSERGKEHKGG